MAFLQPVRRRAAGLPMPIDTSGCLWHPFRLPRKRLMEERMADLLRHETTPGRLSAGPGFTPFPARLLDWAPFLWARVIFPGRAESAGPWQVAHGVLKLLVPGAVFVPCLSFSLFEPDEGRYA